MDIKKLVVDIITNYIQNQAKQKQKTKSEIQLSLYLKSEFEVGIYLMEDYNVTRVVDFKEVLGVYALSKSIVNNFIKDSLLSFSKDNNIENQNVNCVLFFRGDDLKLWLYNKHEAFREITINELIKD